MLHRCRLQGFSRAAHYSTLSIIYMTEVDVEGDVEGRKLSTSQLNSVQASPMLVRLIRVLYCSLTVLIEIVLSTKQYPWPGHVCCITLDII